MTTTLRRTLLLTSVLAAAAALGHGTAQAQSAAQKQQAKGHYDRATGFYGAGKYAEAIEEYQKAYLLLDDPVLLFNIGQAYRRWDKRADAARFYRSYLRRAPNAQNRGEVEQRIADLEKPIDGSAQASGAPPVPPAAPAGSAPPPHAPPTAGAATYAPSAPVAQSARPGARLHDGFYLRMRLGFGHVGLTSEVAGAETSVTGTGGTSGVALGLTFGGSFVLYAEALNNFNVDPTVKVGPSQIDTNNVTAGVFGLGPGVAYYFMPANFYVSGTLVFGNVSVTVDDMEVGETKWGPGLSFMAGKEWWVSDNWGLGVAGQFFYGSYEDKAPIGGSTPTWKATAFTVVFSATFN